MYPEKVSRTDLIAISLWLALVGMLLWFIFNGLSKWPAPLGGGMVLYFGIMFFFCLIIFFVSFGSEISDMIWGL